MSAIFVRSEYDEGIEFPVKELVSKQMLCMMFDIEEKEFLYIINEDEEIEMTMLKSDCEFKPNKAGKYLVKTATEVSTTGVDNLQILESVKSFNAFPLLTMLVNSQPEEMIMKVLRKLDCQTFGKVAQTCVQMQDFLNSSKFSMDIPHKLTISFYHDGLTLMEFRRKDVQGKKSFKFHEDYISGLKNFRLEQLVVDAESIDSTDNMAEVCYAIARSGIQAETLAVNSIDTFLVAALIRSSGANNLVFEKIIDPRFAAFDIVDPCPKLEVVHFTKRVTPHHEHALFSNFFQQNARILRIETISLTQSRTCIDKYMEKDDYGLTKILNLMISEHPETKLDHIMNNILQNQVGVPIERGQGDKIGKLWGGRSARITSRGKGEEFSVYICQSRKADIVSAFIGQSNADFWEMVNHI